MTAIELNRCGPAPEGLALNCPLCTEEVRWLEPPLLRWFCPDCAVFWRHPCEPGLLEDPIRTGGAVITTAPSLLGGDQP